MTKLSINDLSFSYTDRWVLQGVTLNLPEKSLIGIVGPNGCGKSTLLSLVANLLKPASGQILLDGQDLRSYHRRDLATRIAYLPQAPICPAGISVEQVLRFGRHPYQTLFRQFSAEDADRIAEVEQLLGLRSIMLSPMQHLSGGQRQKAWLGMVLVQDTEIILLDEPTSALDIGHQHDVLEAIRLMRDLGKTVVMVIHDLAAAARFCDYIVAMNGGGVHCFGRPGDVLDKITIRALYAMNVDILFVNDCPVIVPLNRHRAAGL